LQGAGTVKRELDISQHIVAWTLQFHESVGRCAQRRNCGWAAAPEVAVHRGRQSRGIPP
jgi:hypothetical protein